MKTPGSNTRKSVRMEGMASPGGPPAPLSKSGSMVQTQGNERASSFFSKPMSVNMNTGDSFQMDDGSSLHTRLAQLEKDLERRQESYITRERAYKMRIDELEEELAAQRESKTGWMKSDSKISKLRAMHSQILGNVELVQDRTARILQEQERDLLRAFRARLFDVQTELEKEKGKKDDGAAAWIERSRQLEAEVEWAKEVADRLERVNQTLLQENNRLKSQFTSQEEDRNFLIKQLVAVKKDNARLRAEYTELENENENLKSEMRELRELGPLSGGAMMKGAGAVTAQQKNDSEEKYKEINIRLRRLLAEERKSTKEARHNYEKERSARTEMELLLRQCVEDVRKEIAKRYVEEGQFNPSSGQDLAKMYGKNPQLIPVDDFSQADRERVLELLLSQERVVSLLYAKTFPLNPASNNKNMDHNSNYDLSQLLDGNDNRPGSSGMDNVGRPNTTNVGGASKIPTLPSVTNPSGRSTISR
eukprot:gene39657-48280_t